MTLILNVSVMVYYNKLDRYFLHCPSSLILSNIVLQKLDL
jgi:hypothetical protein